MKAVVLEALDDFSCKQTEIPEPKHGEVLVRVEAAPINPSDIVFLKGQYGIRKEMPAVAGFEGAGVVVKSGGGLLGWSLVNKRVAVMADKSGGTWAQYIVTSAKNCVKLSNNVPVELGACFFANPFTAVMFMEVIKEGKHKAIVQTAASSAVGKMLFRYAQHSKIPIVNIVRRESQVEMFREMGAEYVLNSNSADFLEQLNTLCSQLGVTCAFDAVSGEMTGILLEAVQEQGVVYIYGALGKQPLSGVHSKNLTDLGKRIEGLWLKEWIQKQGKLAKWNLANKVMHLLPTILKTEISREFALDQINEALDYYKKHMSEGKVILKPNN